MHDVYSRVFGEQLQQMALPFTAVLWSHSPKNSSSAPSVGSGPSKPNPLHFKHRTAVVSFTHPFLRFLEQHIFFFLSVKTPNKSLMFSLIQANVMSMLSGSGLIEFRIEHVVVRDKNGK